MKVEIKQAEGLKREITVVLEAETVKAEMDRQYDELRSTVTLKGFRKGHAPLDMIKSIYSDKVRAETVDKLLKESYPQAVRQENLNVASRPTITALDLTDAGELTYSASMEVYPEIEKVDCEGLELKTAESEVTDEEVNQIVQQILKQQSELRPVEREAAEGDVIIADLHKVSDPKQALKVDEFPESRIDLGNPMTVKEFREQFPGTKAGEEKEITVSYDPDYSDPQFAGASITYRCEIKSVNERVLPEFNDAFAKRIGLVETALELKLKIREDLKKRKEAEQNQLYKREIVAQVCQKNTVPLPEGLMSDYLDSIVADFKKHNEAADEKEIREQYRPVGENTMRWDILWHTLAEQEKIEVLPADTENWINGFAAQNNMTPERARNELSKSGRVMQLRESLLEEKVLDFLLQKARKVPAEK